MTVATAKLGEAVEILSGFAFKSELFNESDGMPVIRIRDVVRGFSETRYSGEFEEGFIVQNGEIVIGMDGNFNAARWNSAPALLNQRVCRIKARAGILDDGYLFHFLPKALKKIEDATPFVTVKHLSVKDVREIDIPLPPLPEQRRIAAILDQADTLRAKRREALAQLDSLTQSIFIEMFGDPGTNPKQWSVQPLSVLVKGKPNNGIFKKNDEYGEGLPVVWVGELFKDNSINCSNSQRLLPSERELEQYGLHHGDILFCRSSLKLAGIGYNNVYLGENNKALFECHVIRITPDKNKLDPVFLNFALRMPSQRQKLFRHAKTVTMTTIDQDGLLRVDLPVPPLHLQKQFAEKLNSIERLKAVNAKAQVELDTLFASLQHRAFRGEL